MLANYLNTINHRNRSGVDLEMELEILKCLKKSLGNKVSTIHKLPAHMRRSVSSTL